MQTIADEYPSLSPDFHSNRYPYIPGDISFVHILSNSDKCPYLYDKQLKHWQLVDSCAAVSVWPTRLFPDAVLNKGVALQAVNQSRLVTYGKPTIEFKISRKTYRHEAYIADVESPIIGNDILGTTSMI